MDSNETPADSWRPGFGQTSPEAAEMFAIFSTKPKKQAAAAEPWSCLFEIKANTTRQRVTGSFALSLTALFVAPSLKRKHASTKKGHFGFRLIMDVSVDLSPT